MNKPFLRHLLAVGLITILFATDRSAAAEPQLPPFHGIAYPLVGTNGGLNQPGYKSTQTIINEVKALGANTVRVTISAGLYRSQNDNASDKALTAQNAPTDAELLVYLRALKNAGLRVYFIPFVNTFASEQVLSGTVRTPTNMATFMADHTANLVRLAQLAQQADVDWFQVFMDDTEGLLRDSANKTYWLNLIGQVRAVYTGAIVGSPGVSGHIFGGGNTHNELIPREIFDALDVIGCTCYYEGELTTSNNPSALTLLAGFRGANNHVDMNVVYEYINRLYMKPLLLVDTSYHSFDGSNRAIAPIYDPSIQLTPDQQEQADLFNSHLAILKEQKDNTWFQGILYSGQNALPANAATARFLKSAFGENIEGKLAEGIVRGWYTGTLPVAAQSVDNPGGNTTGTDGDDTITVTGAGARTIDGGLGLNTIVINAASAAFAVTGDFQSAQVNGAGLQLSLTNIHSIRFSDATVKLPTGGVTLSTTNGLQTLTGYAGNDFISTGPADQVIDGGTGNDIVVANPWYRNTLRVRTARANAFYGTDGARLIVTINVPGMSTRWVSAVGLAKIQFDDAQVTLTGNTVSGTAAQTHLYGSPADDTISSVSTKAVSIYGSAGNDVIDGGASIATVIYPVNRSAFTITQGASQVTITKPNGTDALRNVKFVRFADQTVALTTAPVGAIFSTAQAATQSFLRFFNTGSIAGTVTATLRDYETGQVRGQWTSPSIPPLSEQQFSIGTVESGAGIAGTKPSYYGANFVANMSGYFQHVLFRPTDGTLTNSSTCAAGVTADPARLSGVHTSLIGIGFPSSVVISNTGSTALIVTLGVYDARDGTRLGTYATPTPVPAGGQLIPSISAIEAGAKVTPTGTMYHYVIKAEGPFTGYLQHLVNNTQKSVITDMTTACSLDGSSGTATSSPLLDGAIFSTAQSSSQSFLRFYNTGTTAGTVIATLRDYASGTQLGQWTSPSIPAGAEQQFSISTVESGASITGTKPNYYSMSAASGFNGYFQHVLYRPADGTLTNLSTCAAGVTADPKKLAAVHTSLLDNGFPSSVVINNTGNSTQTVSIGVYDARDGAKLGTYSSASIPAGGQIIPTVAQIETGANVKPSGSMYHYVLKVESTFTGFLQHLVNNLAVGVITDMTTACSMVAAGP